jgi:hypothetical protein
VKEHSAADMEQARKYVAALRAELTGGRSPNSTALFVLRFVEAAFLAGMRAERDKAERAS